MEDEYIGFCIERVEHSEGMGLIGLINELYSRPIKLRDAVTIKIRGAQEDIDKFLILTGKVDPLGFAYKSIVWDVVEIFKESQKTCEYENQEIYTITNEDYNSQLDAVLTYSLDF